MDFLNLLSSSPVLSFFLAVLTIWGFILTYKSTPKKILKYTKSSTELLSYDKSVSSKLKIYYDELLVNRLTQTRITFWNDSFPTINSTDLIKTAPLSILVKNGELLYCSIFTGNESANGINLSFDDDNRIKISFDYLDRKEGAFITIIHTGDSSDANNIDVSFNVKGGKTIEYDTLKSTIIKECLLTIIMFLIYISIVLNTELLENMYTIFGSMLNTFIFLTCSSTLCTLMFALVIVRLFYYPYIPQNCKKDIKEQRKIIR